MKNKIFLFVLYILLIFLIVSCSEKSTNPVPPVNLNEITNPPGGNISKLAINSSGDFFAITSSGLFISEDEGSTWVSLLNTASDIIINSDEYIFVKQYFFNEFNLIRSTDNGATWTDLVSTNPYLPRLSVDGLDNIYAFGTTLDKSTDLGMTWEEIYNSNLNNVYAENNTLIIIGIPGLLIGELLYSTNNGSIWNQTNYQINLSTFYKLGSTIFAGGISNNDIGGGVHKTTDDGLNWHSVGLGRTSINSFISNNQNQLLAGTDDGIYLTPDEGGNWQIILTDSIVTTLMKDSRGYLYAGTDKGTFLRSTNGGMTWEFGK
jgi:photosystem II stability/assembly factor-like uncharacterized protein